MRVYERSIWQWWQETSPEAERHVESPIPVGEMTQPVIVLCRQAVSYSGRHPAGVPILPERWSQEAHGQAVIPAKRWQTRQKRQRWQRCAVCQVLQKKIQRMHTDPRWQV